MPLAVIFWYLFANGREPWDKVAALEAGVFSITVIAYFMFRFDNRPEQDKRAGWLGALFMSFIIMGCVFPYVKSFVGLQWVSSTITFAVFFFVPTVSFLIYFLALVAARFYPATDARSRL
jgi:hypothetical protein